MIDNELNNLREKYYKNIQSAYNNIAGFDGNKNHNQLDIILKYFGINNNFGYNENNLDKICDKFNINYRFVRLNKKWYKNNMLPIIAKYNDSYIAIIPNLRGRCFYYKGNQKIYITENIAKDIDKDAICFYKCFNKSSISRLDLIKYMIRCITIKEYIAAFVIMLAAVLFSTVMPVAQFYIFNNLIPSGTGSDILPIASLLFGVIIISFVIQVVKGIITSNIPLSVEANLQGAVITRLLKLKASFFTKQKAGSLSNSLIKITDISDIFSGEMIASLLSFVLSIVYAFEIYFYAKEFMGYVYIAFFTVIILTLVNGILIKNQESNFNKKANDMSGFVYELFDGMENVKLNNASSVMFNRWSKFYAESLKAAKKPVFSKYFKGIYAFVISGFTLFIYITGISKDTTAAGFITFMSLYGLFIGSVGGIGNVMNSFASFNSSYNQMKEFFMAETEDRENKRDIEKFKGNIEFSNVYFKYGDSSGYVLENISFNIKKGQKIGITGKSGCGKSTLLKLLLGFYKPEKGRIFIDNIDLNEINLSSYRKKIGVVLQSSKLIPADIFSNITLTYPNATYDEVIKAVEAVGLKSDIEKMPMGLHTFVSDDNLTISGGQKQRILLARAIINKPSLLILDEATNALDNLTQSIITKYIESTNTTAVIVAHRLSTIRKCDNILVFDKGKIAEQGEYKDLIDREGIFYNLVKNQI
ncbi:MAG: peptidase domain-containing ABC transporter [Lachnospirales bacterium]